MSSFQFMFFVMFFRWLFLVLQAVAEAKVPVMLLWVLPRKGRQHFSSSLGGIKVRVVILLTFVSLHTIQTGIPTLLLFLWKKKRLFSANGTLLPIWRCRDTFRQQILGQGEGRERSNIRYLTSAGLRRREEGMTWLKKTHLGMCACIQRF